MNTFTQGLVTDVSRQMQSPNSYRYALNAVIETKENGMGSISNELGNELTKSLPENHRLIGWVLTDTADIVLFSTDEVQSLISIYNSETKVFTELVKTNCLNFKWDYPISALFRVRKGCQRTVYFTDNLNKYRYIDLDDLNQFKDELGNWDCNKFNFFKDITVPQITDVTVSDVGGNLPIGAYQFAIRYLDTDNNPTNWFYVTRPVNIYDDSLSANYNQIDGGINAINDLNELGAVPRATKSITLNLSNLDFTYKYVQIGVIVSLEGIGQASRGVLMNPVEVSNSTINIASIDSNGVRTIPISEFTVKYPVFERVKTHVQKDLRLILGGVSTSNYKWTNFQKVANNIKVSYKIKSRVAATLATGDSKEPTTPFNSGTFIGDEIYALGIEFLFKNGEWSPTFHIPGREAQDEDLQELVVGSQIPVEDVAHLGLQEGDRIPLWKYRNTAGVTQLAYHESELEYPSLTCEGERFFPLGKIRHHRMPCRRDFPIFSLNQQSQILVHDIALDFQNVSYPHEDIVGHRFVQAVRDDANSTVLDTAWMTGPTRDTFVTTIPPNTLEFAAGVSPYQTGTSDILQILSPRILTRIQNSRGSYIKFLAEYTPAALNKGYTIENDLFHNGPTNADDHIRFEFYVVKESFGRPTFIPTPLYRNIINQIQVSTRSEEQSFGGKTVRNISYNNFIRLIHINSLVKSNTNYLVSIKQNIDPYTNLRTLVYQPLTNGVLTLSSSFETAGTSYISELEYVNTTNVRRYRSGGYDRQDSRSFFFYNIFIESTLNADLFHGDENDSCFSRWKKTIDPTWHYVRSKTAFLNTNGKWFPRDVMCTEYYGYNRDFSKQVIENPSFSIYEQALICNSCIHELTNRIYYSEVSFQEEITDMYRIFKANNYKDLDATSGPITELFINKYQLYALTPKSLWFISTNPQQLQSTDSVLYIGTGDYLGIPAVKTSSATQGHGGASFQHAILINEMGAFYIDNLSRKILQLNEGVQDISQQGMSNFFEENIPLKLQKHFKEELQIDYQHLQPTHPKGIGYRLGYDPKFNRLLVTKVDYSPLFPLKKAPRGRTLEREAIYFDSFDNSLFSVLNGSYELVDIHNPQFFKNESFTISYSFINNKWCSFHSYLPYNYMFDNTKYFSFKSNEIYEHNAPQHQQYYGKKYPHIIETIANPDPGLNKTFQSIMYSSIVEEYSIKTQQYTYIPEATYTDIILYTRDKNTGKSSILPKVTAFDNQFQRTPSQVSAFYKNNMWHINEMRNKVVDSSIPFMTSEWEIIQDEYPIDKVINDEAVNISKDFYTLDRLSDTYLNIRLFFNPEANYRITTDYINSTYKPHTR